MSFAIHSQLPVPPDFRLADLPRRAQFLILTLRLARELSIEDRNFHGFVYALCGISRVERALAAVGEVLRCLNLATRRLTIEATVVDGLAEDERRLLALLHCRREFGLAIAGNLVPRPVDEDLVQSLNRLAAALE